MYYKKRIGVFISHIYGNFQKKLCKGILQNAAEYGYLVEIFATNDGENLGDYGLGEMGILNIPRPGNYDGFILASDTYLLPGLAQEIERLLQTEFRCPVIAVTQNESPFPRIILENHRPVKDLVLHLGKLHGLQKIYYLGNSLEPDFDRLRRMYFEEGLKTMSLPTADCCYACDGSEAEVERLLTQLKDKNALPQAIVCYNDDMALNVIYQLRRLNIRIPDDIAVTGLDALEFGQNIRPVLTSVTFPIEKMGETAVELLRAAFHGQEIPACSEVCAVPCIGSSCGCSVQMPDSYTYTGELHRRIAFREIQLLSNMHMCANLQGIDDLDQGIELIADFADKLPGCRAFYLCLYDGWDRVSGHVRRLTNTCQDECDSETVLLKLALQNGKRLPECTFTRRSPLPDYLYDDSFSYLYAPLSFGKLNFGYVALSFTRDVISYDFDFLFWLLNINSMLKSLCDKKNLRLLVTHLETVSTRDELTGLLNRQSFCQAASTLFDQAIADQTPVCTMMFHLDCLGQINDAFGHEEGDFAIQVLAHALENSVDENYVCTRQDSGKFQILAPGCSRQKAQTFSNKVQKYLDNYNRLHTKDYIIQTSWACSIRIPVNSSELTEMFRETGRAICEAKQEKNINILKG